MPNPITAVATLPAALLDRAYSEPDAPALTFIEREQHTTFSSAQMLEHASEYAAALSALGIRPGDLVILVLEHSLDLVYAFWGGALLGAIPSIFPFLTEKLDPDLYRQRVKTLVEHSGAAALITYPDFFEPLAALLAGVDCKLLSTADVSIEMQQAAPAATKAAAPSSPNDPDNHRFKLPPATWPLSDIFPDSMALLQHSSGTTGLQKGVALSHRAVLAQIESYSAAIQLDPSSDVVVSWLPLYHDMGLIAGFVMPTVSGAHLVLMSPFDWVRQPAMLLEAIQKYRGTLSWLPNFAYNHIARTIRPGANYDLSSWRAVINCSETVYDQSHQAFLSALGDFGITERNLTACYAMAENTFAVTQSPIGAPPKVDEVEIAALQERGQAVAFAKGKRLGNSQSEFHSQLGSKRLVSNGPAINGVELQILDGAGQPLPERRVGQIALRSPFMLSGYYRRPDLDDQAITPDGWYLTGDMGYLAGGELYITGRQKDLIIVGGKNVYPQDLEAIANRTPGVHPGRAVAFGLFDERIGSEKVVLLCEAAKDKDVNERELEKELRTQVVLETEVTLGDLRIVPHGWIIKTSSGKHARSDNREKYLREFS
jgi:acyl-CoA synthetase (AMP-forming)/AMP-acid ligase II